MLVDTLGFLLGISVTEASVQDRDGARDFLSGLLVGRFGWLRRIWADGGYSGKLIEDIADLPRHRGVELEIVKRSDSLKGFKVLPKRWIVERTFGWLVRNRRLVRDYEVLPEHSIALIQISMIKLMLTRIAR